MKNKKILKTMGKIIAYLFASLIILFALSYLLTIGDYKVLKTVKDDPSLPQIEVNGITLHAEIFGDPDNPVVIGVHGGPGGDYSNIVSIKELSDEYFVVLYDQLGSGLSERIDRDKVNFDLFINELDTIVDRYGKGQKVNLVGQSWGAMLSSAYIGKYPEKVDHAVLSEAGFLTNETAVAWMQKMKNLQPKINPTNLYVLLKAKFESMHIDDKHESADYFSKHAMKLTEGNPMLNNFCNQIEPDANGWRIGSQVSGALFEQAFDDSGSMIIDFTEGVEDFTSKVLFIAAECNLNHGIEIQKIHMKSFPNAELAIIKNSGHLVFFEEPEPTISVIRKYLNDE